jgi:hypothetical protein
MSSTNREYYLFLSSWVPLISFSCVHDLGKTSSNILNRSGESGHSCLIPGLRGKPLSYHVSCGSIVCWELFLKSWMSTECFKCFFCISWDYHMIFILNSVNVMCHIYLFVYLKTFLYPSDKSHLFMLSPKWE